MLYFNLSEYIVYLVWMYCFFSDYMLKKFIFITKYNLKFRHIIDTHFSCFKNILFNIYMFFYYAWFDCILIPFPWISFLLDHSSIPNSYSVFLKFNTYWGCLVLPVCAWMCVQILQHMHLLHAWSKNKTKYLNYHLPEAISCQYLSLLLWMWLCKFSTLSLMLEFSLSWSCASFVHSSSHAVSVQCCNRSAMSAITVSLQQSIPHTANRHSTSFSRGLSLRLKVLCRKVWQEKARTQLQIQKENM